MQAARWIATLELCIHTRRKEEHLSCDAPAGGTGLAQRVPAFPVIEPVRTPVQGRAPRNRRRESPVPG